VELATHSQAFCSHRVRWRFSLRGPSLRTGFQDTRRAARAVQRQSHRLYFPRIKIYRFRLTRRDLCQRHSSGQTAERRIRLEVPVGTVVISGLPKMYYGGIIQSAGAALAQARQKENERARFEVEAGKTITTNGPPEPWERGSKSRQWIRRSEPRR
jgi:hypothetical protein